ncbi:MAG: hypothetical protein IJZ25_01190 [Lachnospiraceae bacterium]|nr:hypothetical protein [Lachnospiraceae bacterium]
MNKKLLVALFLIFCLALVGCQKEDKKDDKEVITESAAKIADEITSGEFVIDGVVYEFPMDLQYWLDNGWHISNTYDNVDEFELEAGATSTEFELFNEEDAYVRVSVMNTSSESAKVQDCMVASLYMSLTEVNAIFPQGINKSSKPDDVLDAYGDPESKGDESGYMEALYYYDDEDSRKCYVELGVVDNSYTIDPLSSVEYGIISFDSMWDAIVASEGEERACEIFLDTTMKTCYWGDYDQYVEYGIDSESGAISLYESEVEYFATCLIYYCEVNEEYVTDEMMERFREVAKEVLGEVEWNVKDIEIDVFDEGTITLELYPTDFFYIIEDGIIDAIDQFNAEYENVDFDSMSDEEYAVVEEGYAESVLKVLEEKASEAGTLDPVEKEFELEMDTHILTDDGWVEVDDTIMNIIE